MGEDRSVTKLYHVQTFAPISVTVTVAEIARAIQKTNTDIADGIYHKTHTSVCVGPIKTNASETIRKPTLVEAKNAVRKQK